MHSGVDSHQTTPRLQHTLQRIITGALVVFCAMTMVSISAMQAAYMLAVLAWLITLCLPGSVHKLRTPLLFPVLALALTSVLATLTAVDPWRSLIELRNICEVVVLYLLVNQVQTEARATMLIRIVIAAGVVMALYGLGQTLVYGSAFRVHGTMSTYMTFANLLMLVGIMILAQIVFPPDPATRRWGVPALAMVCAALLMTQTRSAWLGLVGGAGVLLSLWKPRYLLALPCVVLVAWLVVPTSVRERLWSVGNYRDITAQERFSMWRSGLRMIHDYPWTGVGLSNTRLVYPAYREAETSRDAALPLSHLHNNVLQVTAERGVIGLASWLWLWCAYVWHTWVIYRQLRPHDSQARALVVGSLASVVGFHIAGCFEHTYGDSEVITLVYALMALPFLTQPGITHRFLPWAPAVVPLRDELLQE